MCTYISGVTEETRPAFSATISRDTSFKSGQTYTFGSVTLNIGKMYNPKTGIVHIPSSGNYAITWHVLTNGGYATYPYLKRNGGYIGSTACDARGSRGVRSACGNTIIMGLQQGDQLWIEEWIYNKYQTNVQAGFSSFSAWKL